MSQVPIFKLSKIKHETVKDRKDFILDCLFVGVGVSILYVALEEDFAEGVKALHKNKHRKNIKKIREIYDDLNARKTMLYTRLTLEDRKTVAYKNETIVAKGFISTIAKSKDELNLEYMAIAILKAGLTRKRKTKLKVILIIFFIWHDIESR